MEKLLEEVERAMYFSSCAVTLAQYADFDRFGAEMARILGLYHAQNRPVHQMRGLYCQTQKRQVDKENSD